jgi:hypothetical protein
MSIDANYNVLERRYILIMCNFFIEDSFEQKLFKVVDRKDFEEKWRNEMTEFLKEHAMKAKHGDELFTEQATNAKHEDETPHQKTASETKDNGGNAKMDEILEQVGLMMIRIYLLSKTLYLYI